MIAGTDYRVDFQLFDVRFPAVEAVLPAVLWARAHRGPEQVAISHSTALAAYEISDANPHTIHITVPKALRLRRQKPKGIVVHREDLNSEDITIHEGMPLTTIARTVADLLKSGERIDLIRASCLRGAS